MFSSGRNKRSQNDEAFLRQEIASNKPKQITQESYDNLQASKTSKNPWRLLWGEIGEFEGSSDVYDRLLSVWETVLALGGLIAGFSYVVLSSDVEFTEVGFFGHEWRPYLYGFFSVCTFIVSLGSALLTVILENTLKMAGANCAGWFALKYENLVGMPEALVGTSIGFMLFAGLIAIDGLFPSFVFWFAVVSGIGTFAGLGGVWFVVSNGLKAETARIMLEKSEVTAAKERKEDAKQAAAAAAHAAAASHNDNNDNNKNEDDNKD